MGSPGGRLGKGQGLPRAEGWEAGSKQLAVEAADMLRGGELRVQGRIAELGKIKDGAIYEGETQIFPAKPVATRKRKSR